MLFTNTLCYHNLKMKTNLLLIVCFGSILYFICLAKYNYQIIHHRLSVTYYNKSLADPVIIRNVKLNRTYRAFSVTICLKLQLNSLAMGSVRVNKVTNNAVRYTGISLKIPACTILSLNVATVDALWQHTNITRCPIQPNCYGVTNWNIDDKDLTIEGIPEGNYMNAFSLSVPEGTIASAEWWGELKHTHL